jgi:uncharacterized damage-inducible protein DinB
MEGLASTFAEMERAVDDFTAAVQGVSEAVLSRRPDEQNWSAKEIICHVRDTEEYFLTRFQMILSFDEPKFLPADAGRWAAERQYLRNDVGEALTAFRQRRRETLSFVKEIKADQWERTCLHPIRGRMTLRDYLNLLAGHDKNHLDQIKRALSGKV